MLKFKTNEKKYLNHLFNLFALTFLLILPSNLLSAQTQDTSAQDNPDFEFSGNPSIGDIFIDKDSFSKGDSVSVTVNIESPETTSNITEEDAFYKYVTQDSDGNYVITGDEDSFNQSVEDTNLSGLENSLDGFDYSQSGLPYLNISVTDIKGREVYNVENLEINGIVRQISLKIRDSYEGLRVKTELVLDGSVIDSKEEYFANKGYNYQYDYSDLIYKVAIPLLILFIIIFLFVGFKKKYDDLSV